MTRTTAMAVKWHIERVYRDSGIDLDKWAQQFSPLTPPQISLEVHNWQGGSHFDLVVRVDQGKNRAPRRIFVPPTVRLTRRQVDALLEKLSRA